MWKRAQAATEYLIVLAVVIVIALVVVGVMGGIPGIGKGGKSRASAAYWQSADVGVSSYAVKTTGPILNLRNNLRNTINVTSVKLDGTTVSSTTSSLSVGEEKTFSGSAPTCAAGSSYSYAVSITYVDTATSATYTLDGDGNKLEGECAT